MSSSVDFWYRRISRRATVPGRYRCGFLTPPVAGALFRAAFVASCLRGAFPPVDFLAVCFVLAILVSFLGFLIGFLEWLLVKFRVCKSILLKYLLFTHWFEPNFQMENNQLFRSEGNFLY